MAHGVWVSSLLILFLWLCFPHQSQVSRGVCSHHLHISRSNVIRGQMNSIFCINGTFAITHAIQYMQPAPGSTENRKHMRSWWSILVPYAFFGTHNFSAFYVARGGISLCKWEQTWLIDYNTHFCHPVKEVIKSHLVTFVSHDD